MEGGLHPWRIQRIDCTTPTLDSYGKPLPPPPAGMYWEKQADNSWKLLRSVQQHLPEADAVIHETTRVLEHTVMPTDTIQGICLRYRINVVQLRQWNNFSGNNIKPFKSLLIPLEPGVTAAPQEVTPEVMLRQFMNHTNLETEEAKFYLEEHNWNLQDALSAYRSDEQWVDDQPPLSVPQNTVMPTKVINNARRVVVPHAVVYATDVKIIA